MALGLLETVHHAMRPLADRFALGVRQESETLMLTEVLYANDTTAMRITVDWAEWRPFVYLYQLEQGELPLAASVAVHAGEPLKEFDADDLLILRAIDVWPVGKMFGERNSEGILPLLSAYATALEHSAADVLSGDFAVFTTLADIVAERYRRNHG